jgi:hypothetical protein
MARQHQLKVARLKEFKNTTKNITSLNSQAERLTPSRKKIAQAVHNRIEGFYIVSKPSLFSFDPIGTAV